MKNFVKDFLYWIRKGKITDAPDFFLEMTAYQILSMTVRRNLYVYYGRKKVYPNLWCILIGKSSMFRKSTCLDLAKSFIKPELILPDEYSSERLIEIVSYKKEGILTADEIMTVSKLWDKEYAKGVKSFLTQIYDSESGYKRETRDYTIEIKDPYINFFACSTPVWFQEALNEEDVYGGFLPRFLLIYCWNKKYNYSFPGRGDEALEKTLRKHLDMVYLHAKTTENKELVFSPQARKRIVQYSLFIEKLIQQEGNGLSPFLTRLLLYLIKLSILEHYAIPENLNSKEISLKEVKNAIIFTEKVRLSTEKILGRLCFSSYQVLRNKILEYLESKEEMKYSELLRKLKIQTRYLDEIVKTLEDEELVERRHISTGKKPCILLRLKEKEVNKEIS